MKNTYALSLIVCSASIITACDKHTDEPVPTPADDDRLEINIDTAVGDVTIEESRATDYGFENGDCIGLYVVNYNGSTPGTLVNTGNHVDNMRFIYNGTWRPDRPIYWLDKTTHADFYLYYPYSSTQSSVRTFNVQADQSTEMAYKASDMMVGKALNIAPTTTATVIPVSHIMSRIMVYLEPGNGFTKESLAKANVAVSINNVKCDATVNIATASVSATGKTTSVKPLHVDNYYKALIVPQTVQQGNLITITVDGYDYYFNKAFTFESTKSHKFTVTINRTSNGVNVNINPWTSDGTDNGGIAE